MSASIAQTNSKMQSREIIDLLTESSKDLTHVDISPILEDLAAYEEIVDRRMTYFELARACTERALEHYEWSLLAGRIQTKNLYETVNIPKFSEVIKKEKSMFHPEYYNFVSANADKLDAMIDNTRDLKFDYFAICTLMKSYLLRLYTDPKNYILIETPQQMYMRVATFTWFPNLHRIKATYDDLSLGNYTAASPTLFNAGLEKPACSSCFLCHLGDDMDEIGKSWLRAAIISKNKGGIGFHYGDLRHSKIGHHGFSKGIVPWLKIKNEILNAVDQSSMRKGSAAIFIPDFHIDIFEFLDLPKKNGPESQRARDLFYALWISDLFMRRVDEDGMWSLFCPNIAKGLTDSHNEEFEKLYVKYENEKIYSRQVKARVLWQHILLSQIETGLPYMCYKDSINRKCNQNNLGTIKCSNLCVHPDTKILTDEGNIPIIQLVGKKIKVWNGFRFTPTEVFKTGENQKLLTITFSNGSIIKCTEYHKFYIGNSSCSNTGECMIITEKEVRAVDLKVGMELCPQYMPNTDDEYEGAYKLGDDVFVTSVEDLNEFSDTYCFTELQRNRGVFNGILCGQCVEVTEYTSRDDISSCNLMSIALSSCVNKNGPGGKASFNFKKLGRLSADCVRNLNRIIDRNYYPPEIPEIKATNFRDRPIGIGVQGLADTFAMLDLAWDSEDAYKLNRNIFETMYYYAVRESIELAKEYGPYDSFAGSPASKGKFQFDLWDKPNEVKQFPYTLMYDWESIREQMVESGLRNSLLLALMPTATTAQILGNCEAFEPFTQNIYKRTVLSGEFTVVNKYLVDDLEKIGMWTTDVVRHLISQGGSIQTLPIPTGNFKLMMRLKHLKEKYKTAYELSQRVLVKMGAERGRFVCQSQSHNLFMDKPTYKKLTSYHFFGWSQGLKTGMYYLRQNAKSNPINYSLSVISIPSKNNSIENEDKECVYCSS